MHSKMVDYTVKRRTTWCALHFTVNYTAQGVEENLVYADEDNQTWF